MEAEGEHALAAEQPLAEVAESEQPAAEEPAATSKTNLKSSANIAPTSSAKPSTTNLAKSAGVSTQSIKNKDSTKSATPSAKASAQNIKASSHTRVASKQTLPTGSKKGSRSDLSPTHGSLKSVRLAPPVQQPEQSSSPSANTIVYENTYKMKPNKKYFYLSSNFIFRFDNRFQSEAVKRLVDDILSKTLKPLQYDPATVPELVKSISNDILQEVKSMLHHLLYFY